MEVRHKEGFDRMGKERLKKAKSNFCLLELLLNFVFFYPFSGGLALPYPIFFHYSVPIIFGPFLAVFLLLLVVFTV